MYAISVVGGALGSPLDQAQSQRCVSPGAYVVKRRIAYELNATSLPNSLPTSELAYLMKRPTSVPVEEFGSTSSPNKFCQQVAAVSSSK